MLTRRNFLTQAAKLLAGGVVAASGIVAIVLVKPKVVWLATPEPVLTLGQAERLEHDIVDGIAGGIRVIPITPSLDEAYHNYALALGKTDWELTESERQAAFLNAAVKAAIETKVYTTEIGCYWGG